MPRLSGRASALCAPAILCMLTACANAGVEQAVHTGSFELVEQQTIALSRTISLRYDSCADSRCPQGAKCVWSGKIAYHFTLISKQGSESFTLAARGQRSGSRTHPGLQIVLASELPPAPQAGTAQPAVHPVTVDVVVQ